jgi:hypothetical protein
MAKGNSSPGAVLPSNLWSKFDPSPIWGFLEVLLDPGSLRPVIIMITMVRAAMLALGLACSAEAFTVPSALPAQRLTSRLPLLSAGRAAKVGIQTMMAKEVKERTVRAPVFEEVCEQTGITLSR